MKFKELIEKISINVKSNWSVLSLDDGTEILTNLKLIANGEYQLSLNKDRSSKQHKIPAGSNFKKEVENKLGYKLDSSNKKIEEFIELYPCECPTK